MTQNQCWFVDVLDDIGDGKSLAGTGYSQQGLGGDMVQHAFRQLGDGFRLVSRRLVVGYQFKIHRNQSIMLSDAWSGLCRCGQILQGCKNTHNFPFGYKHGKINLKKH